MFFCNDRVSSKAGGVLLIAPRKLNQKLQVDLAFKGTVFDTLWVDEEFLEQSAISIDRAITDNKTIIMIGDSNINYLENKEKQNLETIIQHRRI